MGFKSWLRDWKPKSTVARAQARRELPQKKPRGRKLLLEALENRIAPAAVNWVNTNGGDWDTATNWSTGTLPGASDDVTIPALANGITITHSTGNDAVNNVTTAAPLSFSGGVLTINGAFQFGTAGTFSITASGALTINGALKLNRSQTVTDNGLLTFTSGSAASIVDGNFDGTFGLVVNGTMAVTNASFTRVNNSNGNDTTSIQVKSGGHLTATNSTFNWDQVALSTGSVLHSGDLTGNGFDTAVFTPSVYVPLLTNNLRFGDVDIDAGDSLPSGQTVSFTQMGTASTANLRYVFPGAFTVAAGATLNIVPGIKVSIARAQTITVNGALNLNALASVIIDDNNFDGVEGIVVNGTMSVTNTSFTRLNNADGNDTAGIQVKSGGHLTASNSTFNWDQVALGIGSILNNGDLTGNGFDATVFTPSAYVPLLTNNLRFQDVDIDAGDNLPSGQTVSFTQMGTASTANLRYVIPGAFTIQAGATLNVVAGVNVLIQNEQFITDNGAFNVTAPASFVITEANSFGGTEGIVVNGVMTVSNTSFTRLNNISTSEASSIQVKTGGHIIASNSTFAWDQLVLGEGSILNSGDLTGNGFDTTVFTPSAYVPLLTNNLRFQDVDIDAGDNLPSGQTVSFTQMGTANTANLRYVIPGAFTIQAGATLNVVPGVNVLIQAEQFITDNGTFNVTSPGSFVITEANSFGGTEGIVVNGVMTVSNASITRFNNNNTGETSGIQVKTGGHIIASNSTFSFDVFILAEGSVLNSGDLTGNGFDTTVFTPAAYVPLFTNNLRFHDVDIDAGDKLPGGQSVSFTKMGTASTANLRYVMPGAFTVAAGATLNLAAGITFVIQPQQVFTVNGTLNVTSLASFAITEGSSLGGTEGIVVNGAMNASATSFTRFNNSNLSDISTIHVNSGGHFTAVNSLFSIDSMVLNAGSTDNIQFCTFQTLLVINSVLTIVLASNDFTNATAAIDAGGPGNATVVASNNYWGTTNSATIAAKITDHVKDPTRATVIFTPPLSTRPADIVASNASVLSSSSAQNVTLTAAVLSPSGTVNEGTATFTVLNGGSTIGTAVTVNVVNGAASATYGLPAGLANGNYTIQAVYSGTANFLGFTDATHVLNVHNIITNVAAASVAVTYSAAGQTVGLSATVTSASGTVNEGTATFTILSGNTVVGTAVTANVVNGAVTVNYALSATTAVGTYTIQAVYNGTAKFQSGTDNTQTLTVHAAPTPSVLLTIDANSDSGAPSHPGYTNLTKPTFDVLVNQAGTIKIDFDGIAAHDQTLTVTAAGTFQFTAPTLAVGAYIATASLDAKLAGTGQDARAVTIETDGPHVTSVTPSGTIGNAVSQITVTFGSLVDLNSFNPAAIALTGPQGAISVSQPQFVSGTTYQIPLATQSVQGAYTLTIAASVTDFAGNKMDQNQNGVNGEPGDSFSGSFTIALPELAITATTAPSPATAGVSLPVSWTVKNLSATGPASAKWNDAVYLSTVATLDNTATRLVSVAAPDQSPLAAGGSYTHTASLAIPGVIATGNYFLLFVANDNGAQIESDAGSDSNDLVADPITIVAPDLQVTGVSGPTHSIIGQSVLVSWTDQNKGTAPAVGPWVDNVYLATDAQGNNPALLGSFTFTGKLAVNATALRTQQVNLPLTSGTYWFVVKTNATGTVGESTNTTNNTTVAAVSILLVPAPLPDLVVTSITPPANGVFSGATVPITFVVKNQGTAATSAPVWHDWVILSQDATLGQSFDGVNDQLLNNQPVILGSINPSYLAVGDSYQQTVNAVLPISAQGIWFVYVVADGTGVHHPPSMIELSRADKLALSKSFSITLSPPPDLAAINVQAPAQDFSGQPLKLNWTVVNNGTGPTAASAWTDAVYMSPNATLDANATLLGKFPHQGALPAGTRYTTSQTVNLPVGLSGSFYFLVKTDVNGQVFENGATSNNVAATTIAETVNLTPPPDLEVDAITIPATARAGHGFTFSYTVTNAGAGDTPNYTWNDALYLSPTPTFDANTAIAFGLRNHQGGLAAGNSYTNTVNAVVPNNAVGPYYVLVTTDAGNAVFELNKNNNTGASTTTLQASAAPPDLVVTSVSTASVALPGSAILVTWTIANQSTGDTVISSWDDAVYADTGSTLTSSAVFLGMFTHFGLLNGGGAYTQSELVTIPIKFLGVYNIFVVADSSNSVSESNTANNTSAGVQIIIILQLTGGLGGPQQAAVSDLQVTSVSAPAAALTNAAITVNWTVKNAGPGATNSNYWYDDVWISPNQTLGSGADVYLGTVEHINPLAAGASYSAAGTFTLPGFVATGNYFVIVATNRPVAPPGDLDGAGVELVFETTYTNNELAANTATAAAVGPLPDLTVGGVAAPASVTAGSKLAVSWTVTNNGAATDNLPITDSVYLSFDQFFDATDRYLGSVTYNGGIAAGAISTQNAALQLPSGVFGTFFVIVVTNSNHEVLEKDLTNNNAAAPQAVQINLPAPADLVAGNILIPANAFAGATITITYQVSNNGANPANGSWYDSLYLSPTSAWNVSDPLLGRVFQTQNVASKGSYTGTLTAALPGVPPGSYFVILRTNILNSFPELTQSNNLSASLTQTQIDAPSLTLGTPTNGTLNQGQSVYYKVTVTAGQTVQINLNGQSTAAFNELYASFGTMPTRAQYDFSYKQPFAANQQITIPTTRSGSYYILIYGDKIPTAPENYSIVAAVIPFSVQTVTPGQLGTGPVTLQINGAQFNFATTFQLRNAGGTIINATRTLLQDSATAFATFNLTAQPQGSYDVWAQQADSTTTKLAAAVTVAPASLSSVQVQLIVPQAVLVGRPGTITIAYSNPGNTDVPAPLLLLSAQNALFQTPGQTGYFSSSLQLIGFNPNGPFGTLPPGFHGSINVSFKPISALPGLACTFTLQTLADVNQPFDWNAVTTNDLPINTSAQQWAALLSQAQTLMGNTWGSVVSFLDTNSVQLVGNVGASASATALSSLYNFDALLQYTVGVYGAGAAAVSAPAFSVIASEGEVTLSNAHVDGAGKPVPLASSNPTFVIIPGLSGYRSDFANLAQAIAADTTDFPSGHVNIILVTWQGATGGPLLDGLNVPWIASLHIVTDGNQLADLLNTLVKQGSINLSTTTIIGEGLGSYVGSQAAQSTGGLGNILALNPENPLGGYLPPDLTVNFQHSTAYETSSFLDTQTSIAASNQTLPTGDLNNPVLQHTFGVNWLTGQIQLGNGFLLNAGFVAGADSLPAANNPPPPSFPQGNEIATLDVVQVVSDDPNNIVGPKGSGANQFVTDSQPLPYQITFTNQSTANGPAQKVVITQKLDANVDWRTFRLGSFGFGGANFQIPGGRAFYQTTLDFTKQFGFQVQFTATIDESTGIATWTFVTVDPKTGEIPLDPTLGILPPDNANGVGEGFVSYTISASQTDVSGTVILAKATVTFDTQPPLDTPQIFNTVDTGAGLTSSVAALPAVQSSTQFTVSWSGSTSTSGSAIASFTIYVSDNGGPFTPWLSATTLTSAVYAGQDGHTYGFFSVALDNAGNQQALPAAVQATTTVDAAAPTSTVTALNAFSGVSFTVAWSGSHSNGIAIATFDVYVSDNGGAFTVLLAGTTQTATTFGGVDGHTYGFYSVATDTLGNRQPTPGAVQTSTIVDGIAPTSAVAALPAFSTGSVNLSWSGSDTGSGIATFDIFVSDNGGAFVLFRSATTRTAATFTGIDGHTYGFYSVATDKAGNRQPTPAAAQATTSVDATAPTSTVAVLPAFSVATFSISWSGSDSAGGSGLATFDVFVSDNGASFAALLTATKSTSTTFTGVDGHSYSFYSLATDLAGNRQSPPSSGQTGTTVDTTAPSSTVTALPQFSLGNFTVGWSGSDGSGSGVAAFDVFVADNGGVFTPWLTNTTLTSATWNGSAGHTYGFYSVATDKVGNRQATPSAAQTSTTAENTLPTSTVAVLPAFSPGSFTLSWSGSETNGASIVSYDIFSSDNGGPFQPLLTATAQTSTNFAGTNGHRYAFYSVATDNAGVRQPTPAAAQATTTVDSIAPSSTVAALPATSAVNFLVNWSGSDGSGSGIASFDVLVSDNGGAFTNFVAASTQTSATFRGQGGHSYGFYSIATDNAGNRQPTPSSAQAVTQIPALPVLAPPAQLGQMAANITHSVEHYQQFITNAYQTYLGRLPDAAGLNGWVNAMQHGLTDEQLEANFIGSTEYINKHGGLGAGWVTALYQNLLGRTPSQAEVNQWVAAIQNGATPGAVAFGFAASVERERNRVRGDYQTFLGRVPAQSEVDSWVSAFGRGLTNEDLVTGFLDSVEYYTAPTKGNGDNLDWIKSATLDELGRTATNAEISADLLALMPANLGAVAGQLTHSDQQYSRFITNAYQTYLGRLPDAAGLAGWINAMQHGLTDEQLEANFIGSTEYINKNGGLGAPWVTALYQNLLGRTPSQAEVNQWVTALHNGATPQAVAYGFAASVERERNRVTADYFTYLGRTAAQSEIDGWVNAFTKGLTNESLVAGFLGSFEYYNSSAKGKSDKADWITSAVQDLLQRPANAMDFSTWGTPLT